MAYEVEIGALLLGFIIGFVFYKYFFVFKTNNVKQDVVSEVCDGKSSDRNVEATN